MPSQSYHPFLLYLVFMWLLTSILVWFKSGGAIFIGLPCSVVIITLWFWFRDLSRESTIIGSMFITVQSTYQLSFLLFILSEVMFFFSFFWSFVNNSVSSGVVLSVVWPFMGLTSLDPLEVPLLNTVVLLSSGVTVTMAHHCLLSNNNLVSATLLFTTINLGIYFTVLQLLEYNSTSYSIQDTSFGSSFYISTGFHGLHVIFGSLFLISVLLRMLKFHSLCNYHLHFVLSIWYWHFVDIIWIFLFILVYIIPSGGA